MSIRKYCCIQFTAESEYRCMRSAAIRDDGKACSAVCAVANAALKHSTRKKHATNKGAITKMRAEKQVARAPFNLSNPPRPFVCSIVFGAQGTAIPYEVFISVCPKLPQEASGPATYEHRKLHENTALISINLIRRFGIQTVLTTPVRRLDFPGHRRRYWMSPDPVG